MNPIYPDLEPVRLQSNINHYYASGRLRAYCCGCIYGESNVILICFFWAAISFYFAVLAFLQKSPFYSYVDTVPLVAFGAINLLFGIVTLTSMVIFLFRNHMLRLRQAATIITLNDSRRTVFAITSNALAVLIVTLVNFILFVMNKDDFRSWCINTSINYVEGEYAQVNHNAKIPPNKLGTATDIYNCDRLYQDEVKWSLLCLIIMSIVYIHWILIVAARKAYNFYNMRSAPPLMNEFANIAPKGKKSKKLNVFRNVKPPRNLMRDLLTHKQYGEFIPEEDQIYLDEKLGANSEKVNTKLNSNIIHFEDNIYNSKEEIQAPTSAFHTDNAASAIPGSPHSASTVIVVGNST